jgi:hypothetical protein
MFHTINLPAAWLVVTSLSLDMLKDIDEGEILSHICDIMPLRSDGVSACLCPTGGSKLALALQSALGSYVNRRLSNSFWTLVSK